MGDCKDFSSVTVKILRSLGFKAYVCFIHQGQPYLTPKLILPGLGLFNHAIVKAISPSGKIYWIDPTNLVSMADYIFTDISDRGVLVLDGESSSYEETSAIDPGQAQMIRQETITFKKEEDTIQRQGSLTFQGQEAQEYTAFNLLSSKDTIEHVLLESLGTNNDIRNYEFKRDEIKSRTVKTVTINYKFEQNDDSPFSNKGQSFNLSSQWVVPFLETSIKQEGISFLSSPHTLT